MSATAETTPLLVDWIWLGNPSIQGQLFPIYWEGFQPELFNYLIINYLVKNKKNNFSFKTEWVISVISTS